MINGNYFDITDSFKVDSSTYHVLGLRQVKNQKADFILNWTCEN